MNALNIREQFKILEEKESCVRVEKENLEEFLGRARYTFQKKNEEDLRRYFARNLSKNI